MSKVRDLLTARRDEIEAEIASLQTELKELGSALTAIGNKSPARKGRKRTAARGAALGSKTRKRRAKAPQTRPSSISDQSIEILVQNPAGLRTAEIAGKLEESYGRKATTGTLSTQLSSLKRRGRLVQDGRLWKLPAEMSGARPGEQEAG